jgi:putative ABC transport system permease protein
MTSARRPTRLRLRARLLASRLRAILRHRRSDRDLDEEIAHHLALLADEARAGGADDRQARAAALRRFGGLARTREAYREQRGFARVDAFWLDLRLAARALGRRPLLLAAASLSIAIGAGLNVGIYAAITRVLFQTTLSGASSERLVAINGEISYPNYQDLRGLDAFTGVAAMQVSRVPWRTGSGTTRVGVKIVSPNFFDVVGIRAAYGRTFHEGDEAAATTVLGNGFWRRRLGGDPSVIGRTLTLNGWPYVVAGVLPQEFNAPVAPMVASDLYVAISPQVSSGLSRRGAPQFDLVARLRDGVTAGQARAAVNAAVADLERRFPRENARLGARISVASAAGVGSWRGLAAGFPLLLLAASAIYGVVGLVLIAACANVAGLLLARAEERRKEIAVCAALGATRWRIAQRFVAESLLIATLGCALAAVLFKAGAAAITQLAWTAGALTLSLPPLPLGYCAALVLAVTAACAIGPAWSISREAPARALHAATTASGSGRTRARRALVVAQVAICFVLLSGASMLFHDVLRIRGVDPGFDTVHTLSIEVRLPASAQQARPRPFERVRAALTRLPGVEAVSAARNMPLMFLTWRASLHGDRAPDTHLQADIMPVGPRYLETMRIPVLRGRDLADVDIRYTGWTKPIVVNDTLARRFFGGSNPIGLTLTLEGGGEGSDQALEIVGVARDSKMRSLDEEPHPVIYLPEIGDFYFVRVAGDPAAATRSVEQAVSAVVPAAWVEARPMASQVEFAQRPARLGSSALAALGGVGLAMAMVGLYAIINYTVNRRTPEIGVRLALGATRAAVVRMIVLEGLVLTAFGCALGGIFAQLGVRVVSSIITLNQGRFDLLALAAAAAATLLVGAAACLAPALRGAGVDPAVALRAE